MHHYHAFDCIVMIIPREYFDIQSVVIFIVLSYIVYLAWKEIKISWIL